MGAWLCWEEGMGAVSPWPWETWSSWKFNQSEFRFCFSSNCKIVFRQNLASSKHQTVSWEILPVQSSPRKVKSSTFLSSITSFYLFRDHILVTGGYSWNSIIGKTESLNLTSKDAGNWQSLSTLNTPRSINKIWKNELTLIFWRYLHACSPILLKNSKLGAIVAGGYSDKYLNSTEIYFPEENR